MSISIQPENQNLLQSTKFQLNFDRLPYLTFFCTSANIPGVSIQSLTQPTPFINLTLPGNKLTYESLEVSFLVDEDFMSWRGIHDWIRGLAFPTGFDEYSKLIQQRRTQVPLAVSAPQKLQYSDAFLTVYTNKNNPNFRVHIKDCFPITLSSIMFNTENSADTIVTASATFKFNYYEFEKA